MIIRSAVLEGSVKPEDSARFDAFISNEIVPLMKQFPGVKSVRVLRANLIDEGGTPLHMIFESKYESMDAMNHAFTHPVRLELRAKLKEILELFEGRMYHVTQDVLADDPVAAA